MVNKQLFKQKYRERITTPYEREIMDYHDDMRKLDIREQIMVWFIMVSVFGSLLYGFLFDANNMEQYMAMAGMSTMAFCLIYFLVHSVHKKKRNEWQTKRDELSDVSLNQLFSDVGLDYTYKPTATMQDSVVNKLRNVVTRSDFAKEVNIIDMGSEITTPNGSVYYVDIEHEREVKRKDSDGRETTEKRKVHLYHGLYGFTPIRDTELHVDIDSFYMLSVHRGKRTSKDVLKRKFYHTMKFGEKLYVTSSNDEITQRILDYDTVRACLASPQFELLMISYGYVHVFYRTHNDTDEIQHKRMTDKPFDIFRQTEGSEKSDKQADMRADDFMLEDIKDVRVINEVLRMFD